MTMVGKNHSRPLEKGEKAVINIDDSRRCDKRKWGDVLGKCNGETMVAMYGYLR